MESITQNKNLTHASHVQNLEELEAEINIENNKTEQIDFFYGLVDWKIVQKISDLQLKLKMNLNWLQNAQQ